MKFHFQVIHVNGEELNPVISAVNGYEAYHILVEVCRNNDIIPARITLVDTADDEGEILCCDEDEPVEYWHKL